MIDISLTAELIFEANAQLGEGLIWHTPTQKLYWVDIEGQSFNVFDPISMQNKSYNAGKRVSTVVSHDNESVLVALEDGIATINLNTGAVDYKLVTDFHLAYDRRFNDGKCDPQGRFWVGTHSMSGARGVNSLYCITGDFNIIEKITGVSISNGITWSSDHESMYYIDTPTREVVQYDFDWANGDISNKTVIINIPEEMGYPDGMTIDSDGMLWIALWDGFCVIKLNPSTGEILQKVSVPAPKVTSCAFGGPNLDTLFITTASVEMSEEELKKYPFSGGIFSVKTGTVGIPAYTFNKWRK